MTALHSLAATGVEGFDDVLRGGFPRNRMYLLQGDPGVGKTTVALQFLLEGARQNERTLYITLSETREEIEAVAQSHGWSLDRLSLFELSAAEQNLSLEQNSLFNPAEIELPETTSTLLAEVERIVPSRVVFDSLSELRLLAQESLRYRRQILALKQYFAKKRSTVLLLDDGTSGTGDSQLESLVHGVVLLEQLSPEYGAERRRLRVKKLRGVKFRGGHHDYTIETGGVRVYPRLVAAEHPGDAPNEVLGSGVDGLDRLLGGGLNRGTSTLFVGPAGCGKSSLLLHFAVAVAARGERAALFSFEERLDSMMIRCAALNIDLESQLQSGRLSIHTIDPAELTTGQFTQLLRALVEGESVRFIGIDSLNGYMNAMPEERFLTLHLHEILTYLGQQGVVSALVMAQHGLIGAMTAPVDVSYIADTVVLLRFFEAHGAVRKAISVIKKRSGPHEDTIRELELGRGGVRVGEPLVDFHGVLTGVPTFTGQAKKLIGSQPD